MSMMYTVKMDRIVREWFHKMQMQISDLEARVSQLEKELKREKFLNLPKDMSLQEQAKALEEHRDTPMTYQEMRERFG